MSHIPVSHCYHHGPRKHPFIDHSQDQISGVGRLQVGQNPRVRLGEAAAYCIVLYSQQ